MHTSTTGLRRSIVRVAEVLFQHVDGGDIKLMMRVRPATTPRRHQTRLPSGDDGAAKILRHSPPADDDGTEPPPPTPASRRH